VRSLLKAQHGLLTHRRKFTIPSFQLTGLPSAPFAHLFDFSDDELRQQGIRRTVATSNPGFPCRISLSDAEVGEELLLLPYTHLRTHSPYNTSGPIFVRKGVEQRIEPEGHVPPDVSTRPISLRAYDHEDMMVRAEVAPGTDVAETIERIFDDPAARYIHLHNAKVGCFFCSVARR
jgi:Protein of unknown function (DUF1203)